MPSFLSKVFGRKKDAESPSSAKGSSPLEGKFEVVSPTVSPSAARFTPLAQQRAQREHTERDGPLTNLLRAKSARVNGGNGDADAKARSPKSALAAPHLSLNLSDLRDERKGLSGVFGSGMDGQEPMSEEEIAARLLDTAQTIALVRACAKYIDERGLETLGLMHPKWYSSSPDVQRRLISLFLRSLAAPAAAHDSTSRFTSEVGYTRDPHDVAAVLRWALRHFQPNDAPRFGGDADGAWYAAFARAEREADYPVDAFTRELTIPAAHHELLLALLDLTFSLTAHAEANGLSGSKFSKLIGLWLLEDKGAKEVMDWETFYAAWERAGRMLEHLFLARIRNEVNALPQRVTSLVQGYPYGSPEDGLLARPRFSTRRYPSLLVQIDTELPSRAGKLRALPRRAPRGIVADALRAVAPAESSELAELWVGLQRAAAGADGIPDFTRVFVTETVNLLALSPTSVVSSPSQFSAAPASSRARAASASQAAAEPTASASRATVDSSWTLGDWTSFQSGGFTEAPGVGPLAATLMDADVERTQPPEARPGVLNRKSSTRHRVKLSLDIPPPSPAETAPTPSAVPAPDALPARTVRVLRIELDEAFADFWADAQGDAGAGAHWPQLAVCQLRAPLRLAGVDAPPLGWVVLERTFTVRAPTPEPAPTPAPALRALSPTPSEGASTTSEPRAEAKNKRTSVDLGATLSATKKRFGAFSRTLSGSEKHKAGKGTKSPRSTRIGEMGEVLPEEDERQSTDAPASAMKQPAVAKEKTEEKKDMNIAEAAAGVGLAAVAAGVGATLVAEAVTSEEAPKADEDPKMEKDLSTDEISKSEELPHPEPTGADVPTGSQQTVNVPATETAEIATESSKVDVVTESSESAAEPTPETNEAAEDLDAPASSTLASNEPAELQDTPKKTLEPEAEDLSTAIELPETTVPHEDVVASAETSPTAKPVTPDDAFEEPAAVPTILGDEVVPDAPSSEAAVESSEEAPAVAVEESASEEVGVPDIAAEQVSHAELNTPAEESPDDNVSEALPSQSVPSAPETADSDATPSHEELAATIVSSAPSTHNAEDPTAVATANQGDTLTQNSTVEDTPKDVTINRVESTTSLVDLDKTEDTDVQEPTQAEPETNTEERGESAMETVALSEPSAAEVVDQEASSAITSDVGAQQLASEQEVNVTEDAKATPLPTLTEAAPEQITSDASDVVESNEVHNMEVDLVAHSKQDAKEPEAVGAMTADIPALEASMGTDGTETPENEPVVQTEPIAAEATLAQENAHQLSGVTINEEPTDSSVVIQESSSDFVTEESAELPTSNDAAIEGSPMAVTGDAFEVPAEDTVAPPAEDEVPAEDAVNAPAEDAVNAPAEDTVNTPAEDAAVEAPPAVDPSNLPQEEPAEDSTFEQPAEELVAVHTEAPIPEELSEEAKEDAQTTAELAAEGNSPPADGSISDDAPETRPTDDQLPAQFLSIEEVHEPRADQEGSVVEFTGQQLAEAETTSEEPPVEEFKPPAEESKAGEPPVEVFKVEEPPVEEPKVEEPPVEESKEREPQINEPPVEEPPVAENEVPSEAGPDEMTENTSLQEEPATADQADIKQPPTEDPTEEASRAEIFHEGTLADPSEPAPELADQEATPAVYELATDVPSEVKAPSLEAAAENHSETAPPTDTDEQVPGVPPTSEGTEIMEGDVSSNVSHPDLTTQSELVTPLVTEPVKAPEAEATTVDEELSVNDEDLAHPAESHAEEEMTSEEPEVEEVSLEEPTTALSLAEIPVVQEPIADADNGESVDPEASLDTKDTADAPSVTLVAEEQPPASLVTEDVAAVQEGAVEEPAAELSLETTPAGEPVIEDNIDKPDDATPEQPALEESAPSVNEPVTDKTVAETPEPSQVDELAASEDATDDVSAEPIAEEPASAEATVKKPAEAADSGPADEPSVETLPSEGASVDVPTPVQTAVEPASEEEMPTEGRDSQVDAADNTEEAGGSADAEEKLPPAPKYVVMAGSTPGPQLALSTSEPATIHQAGGEVNTSDMLPTESSSQAELLPEEDVSAPVEEHIVERLAPSAQEELPLESSTSHRSFPEERTTGEVVPETREHSNEALAGDADVAAFASTISDPIVAHPSRLANPEDDEETS